MKAIYIDESKSKAYVICAVTIPFDKVPPARKAVNSLRLKGQSRIHFVFESARRRRQILARLKELPMRVILYVARDLPEAEARKKCLEAMIQDLDTAENYQIWIEADANHLELDRRTLSRAIWKLHMATQVDYRHVSSKFQILLWIPDAIAWVKNRGGEWTRELDGFELEIKDL